MLAADVEHSIVNYPGAVDSVLVVEAVAGLAAGAIGDVEVVAVTYFVDAAAAAVEYFVFAVVVVARAAVAVEINFALVAKIIAAVDFANTLDQVYLFHSANAGLAFFDLLDTERFGFVFDLLFVVSRYFPILPLGFRAIHDYSSGYSAVAVCAEELKKE